MAQHELKAWPEYFQPVLTGEKTFEVRRDDRGFAVGDVLWLREYDLGAGYTGREVFASVPYTLKDSAWVKDGFVVMALAVFARKG